MKSLTFTISDDMLEAHDKWYKKHQKKCKGSIIYSFTNASGIGTSATVHCELCKSSIDVTDYDEW